MRVQIAEDVIWRDLGDEVVILNLATSTYFGLGGAGSHMWRQLAEHGSIDRALATLHDQFDVEAQVLRADMEALVRDLESRNLIAIEKDAFVKPTDSKRKTIRKRSIKKTLKLAKKKSVAGVKRKATKRKPLAHRSKTKARK